MTALLHAQTALVELRASDAYKQFAANKTLPRTHVGKCELELLAAISELLPTPPPVGTYPEAVRALATQVVAPQRFGNVAQEISEIWIRDTLGDGLSILNWNGGKKADTVGRFNVHDVRVDRTGDSGGDKGTTGFNYRIGQTCDLARFVGRDPYWSNLWLSGWAVDCTFTDGDLEAIGQIPDPSHPGKPSVYIEHGAVNPTFTRSRFKATGHAIIGEWWHPDEPWYVPYMPAVTQKNYPRRSGPYGGRFDDLILTSLKGAGIMFGPGYFGAKIATQGKIKLVGCPGGGIVLPKRLADPSQPNTVNEANLDLSEYTGPRPAVSYHDMQIG